jgi:hypothetical protein
VDLFLLTSLQLSRAHVDLFLLTCGSISSHLITIIESTCDVAVAPDPHFPTPWGRHFLASYLCIAAGTVSLSKVAVVAVFGLQVHFRAAMVLHGNTIVC